MSDQVTIQLISSAVTLLAIYLHRMQGSRENKAISVSINGDRTLLLERMDALQKEVTRLSGANIKLETEKSMDGKPPK